MALQSEDLISELDMKRAVIALLALLALAVGVSGVLRREEADDVRLTGVVSANEAFVASELSGRLKELRVEEGDRVEKSQVVAVLATEEIDAQRQRQLAAIDQLSARLEQGEERVRLETARVKSQIESAEAQLSAIESLREELRAELDQAAKDLERTSELLEQGLVARQLEEQQETAVEVARARLQTANDRVEAARAELEIHRASERQVRVMEQEVEQTKAEVAQARAELEQISVRLGYTELRSPLSGIVSVRVAREGEFVAAGSPVVTIVDLADVWVRAEVEETLLDRIVLGQPLEVILASDLELTGKVTFISPEAGFATQRDVDRVKRDIRTFGIKVALDNPEGRIHPGMTAFVVVPGGLTAPAPEGPEGPEGEVDEGGEDDGDLREAPATTEAPAPPRPAVLTGTAIAAPSAPPEAATAPPPKEARGSKPSERDLMKDAPKTERPAASKAPKPSSPAPAAAPRRRAAATRVPVEPPAPVSPGDAERPVTEAARTEEIETAAHRSPSAEAPTEVEPAPSLEELLETIDMEDPSDADLALLEAALGAGPTAAERGTDRGPASDEERIRTTKPAPPPALSASPSEPPPLRLEGISVAEGKPVAVINGVRLFEGDSVSGIRVVRIREDSVVLDHGGRSITLRF
jgi:HlyD family secretion protein